MKQFRDMLVEKEEECSLCLCIFTFSFVCVCVCLFSGTFFFMLSYSESQLYTTVSLLGLLSLYFSQACLLFFWGGGGECSSQN